MDHNLNIFVFKTNLDLDSDVVRIEPVMLQMKEIKRWTVDREDSDRVLRVEATCSQPHQVISGLQNLGYHCEELTD